MQNLTGETGLSLVADIGGTNTRVALARGAAIDRATVTRYANARHPDLAAVLTRYLSETGVTPDQITGVCVAAAGPVHEGIATLTNLDWRIDRVTLSRALTADKVAVLNDLQAQGHAIGSIDGAELEQVIPMPASAPLAARLVVGIGTGFNACPVIEGPGGRVVPAAEAGHVSLPCCNGRMQALAEAMAADFGFASVEEVLSGRGIGYLHRHLHGESLTASEIMQRMADGEARADATGAALVEIIGTVVGDLALAHLPFGGIYLVGGVSRAVSPHLSRFGFAEHFRAKGRFAPFMERFGVSVLGDDYAALTGCAAHLARL
jgi:glucokinase